MKLERRTPWILGGLLVLTLGASGRTAAPENPSVVVGTFDSRAVLMARVRSRGFEEYLGAQKADMGRMIERARESGDLDLVADLEALGPAMQQRIHEQGFGTAPIDRILALIEDDLPAIAAETGVDVIVSKWDLTWRSENARFVDVTERLVAEFDPDPATLEGIRQLMQQEPVPVSELRDDH